MRDSLLDLLDRGAIGGARAAEVLDRHVDDDLDRLADIVEHQYGIGKHHVEVGDAEIVGGRLGQALEVAHDVIGQKPDRTTEESRQAVKLRRAMALDLLTQRFEGVLDRADLDADAGADHLQMAAARTKYQAMAPRPGKYSAPTSPHP